MVKSKGSEIAVTDYSQYSNVGLKGLTSEDIRPPVAFLVQSIKNKSELVDAEGKECPDGSFFLKGTNEIFKTMPVYVIWIKKDHYQVKENSKTDDRWQGSRMYRTIMVRASDLTPFAINFAKSSLGGLNDLLTAAKSKNLPIFIFKCELRAVLAQNKEGISYFKSVVAITGQETDKERLDFIFDLAKGFDSLEQVTTQEDEVEEVVTAAKPSNPTKSVDPSTAWLEDAPSNEDVI